MKSTGIFLFLFFLTANAAAQEERILPVKQREVDSKTTINDFIKDSLSCIEIISLKPHLTESGHYIDRTILRNGSIHLDFIKQGIPLDTSKWNELAVIFDIPPPMEDSYTSCYMPRNGILFYSKTGELISYLEICFQCNMHRYTGIPISNNEVNLTHDQYEKLKRLFNESGMKIYESK